MTRTRPLKPDGRRRSGGSPASAQMRAMCAQDFTSAVTPSFRSFSFLIFCIANLPVAAVLSLERGVWLSRVLSECPPSCLSGFGYQGPSAAMQARDLRARDLFGQVKTLVEGFEAERKARQAAEAANKAKSELLATISHELRTPMEAVVAMAELLLR